MKIKIVFGPVPSRRLGQSLGINNIPPKKCSYSCVYCQIGNTQNKTVERQAFYPVQTIIQEVSCTIERLKSKNERIDFLSFVPDGEPTLDINLGKELELLKKTTGIKTAVITNSSTLWKEDVRKDLCKADLVSLKIDSVDKEAWSKINRPASELDLHLILQGIKKFSAGYKGTLITESLLVKNINDGKSGLRKTAEFIASIKPEVAFIGIPTRPPAEKFVVPPDKNKLETAFKLFGAQGLTTEASWVTGEGNFGFTGNAESDLLNIVSVHPMSKSQIEGFLKKAGASWDTVEKLLKNSMLKEIDYGGQIYYLKNFDRS